VTTTIGTTRITRGDTDGFVEALRAHSRRYHDQHPFHVRMNAGRLSRRQVQGWVANRFYYQENIPRKDAAILSNCPDHEVRRRWIRRSQRRGASRYGPWDRIPPPVRGGVWW
jgi:pyrroloquinoline-quinone synthase